MPQHETRKCPRCSEAFECKVGDITNCQCYGLALSVAEEAYIAEFYPDGCLCRNCLTALKSRYALFVEQKVLYTQR